MATEKTFDIEMAKIANDLVETLKLKRADYGPGNILEDGEYGILVRVSDKVQRLRNLFKAQKDPNFESIADSWRDIAGYALLAMLLNKVGHDEFRTMKVNARDKFPEINITTTPYLPKNVMVGLTHDNDGTAMTLSAMSDFTIEGKTDLKGIQNLLDAVQPKRALNLTGEFLGVGLPRSRLPASGQWIRGVPGYRQDSEPKVVDTRLYHLEGLDDEQLNQVYALAKKLKEEAGLAEHMVGSSD